jgi:hypothetical protein
VCKIFTLLAEIEGEKYYLLNRRFELPKIDGRNVILVKTVSAEIFPVESLPPKLFRPTLGRLLLKYIFEIIKAMSAES